MSDLEKKKKRGGEIDDRKKEPNRPGHPSRGDIRTSWAKRAKEKVKRNEMGHPSQTVTPMVRSKKGESSKKGAVLFNGVSRSSLPECAGGRRELKIKCDQKLQSRGGRGEKPHLQHEGKEILTTRGPNIAPSKKKGTVSGGIE